MTLRAPFGRLAGRRRPFGAAAATLADQAVVSASAFAVTILVARKTGAAELGEFVLGYTALLLVSGVQAAFVTQPHNVLGATRRGEAYARYTTATAASQAALTAATSGAGLLAAAAAFALDAGFTGLLVATAFANAGWQSLELCRRLLYTEVRPRAALAVDAVGYGGGAAAVAVLAARDQLTSVSALVAVGGAAVVAAALGVRVVAGIRPTRSPDWRALAENWRLGKWIGAARVLFWASTYALVYLAAIVAGPAAAGSVRAAQLVLGPLNVLLLALEISLPPRFARVLDARGLDGLGRALRRVYALTAPPVAACCLVAALAAEPLLRLLYGDAFAADAELVRLFALGVALLYAAQVGVAALYARRRMRHVFVANLAAAAAGVTVGSALTVRSGAAGAVAGMALAAAVLAVAVAVAYRRRDEPAEHAPQATSAPAP